MTATRPNDEPVAHCPADAAARPAWVADALTRQLALYRSLDTLSLRQSALIEGDDTDRLLVVLGERQVLVEQIAAIGARLEPIRAAWESFLLGLPPATRDQIRELVDALADLAGQVAGRDEADRRCLEMRRAAVGAELTTVGRGRSALMAYGGKAAPTPIFQDREI
jgi:hypothetical protein